MNSEDRMAFDVRSSPSLRTIEESCALQGSFSLLHAWRMADGTA